MAFTVTLASWQPPPNMAVRSRTPTLRVRADDGSVFFVHVLLSFEQQVNLTTDLGVDDKDGDDEGIDRALLRYGVRWVESAIRDGIIPGEGADSERDSEIRIREADLPLLVNLAGEKECGYQLSEGRDLYCSAADPADKTAVGTRGLRRLAPTSRPLCAGCGLPDTDYVCSHLLHPGVVGITAHVGIIQRRLVGAICDIGREEIRNPGQCRLGGNPCWIRTVERELPSAEPASPQALLEALDYFALAWRVTFGRALLRLRSVSDATGLLVPCASRADVQSRLSDLADILKRFDIPDELLDAKDRDTRADSTLVRMEALLRAKLEQDDFEAAKRSTDMLKAVARARAGLQHSGATGELPPKLAALGVAYPPTDWASAWDEIRARVTEALRNLARIVQRLAPG
jgi:hypothetical protein